MSLWDVGKVIVCRVVGVKGCVFAVMSRRRVRDGTDTKGVDVRTDSECKLIAKCDCKTHGSEISVNGGIEKSEDTFTIALHIQK